MIIPLAFPKLTQGLFTEGFRYYVLYGGRASSKSWTAAKYIILTALQKKQRILCVRETMSSISHSVHKLLKDMIEIMHLDAFFDTTNNKIQCINGSTFIFTGIRDDPAKVKSTEGVDICFIEEAESISEASWEVLIPTIRKPGSKFIIVFNSKNLSDPTYQRFVINTPPRTWIQKINYLDNPFCPQEAIDEAEYCRSLSEEDYNHIWLGEPLNISDAVIFKNKYEVREFEEDSKAQWRIGLDFGYTDSLAAVKCYVTTDDYLYICEEAGGTKIEMDDMPNVLIKGIPIINKWPVKADAADPKAILFLKRRGWLIKGVKKGPNSILDGITYMKSFRKIYIHPRCKMTIEEFQKYSWEVDRLTGDILPRPKDKFNHFMDAIRYSLEDIALSKSTSAATWSKLAKL
jgi:phage terminase large subunit